LFETCGPIYININFQTNLLTSFEDFYVSVNASVASINLNFFSFQ